MSEGTVNPNPPEISAEVPDWSREVPLKFWEPAQRLLASIRTYQKWKKRRSPWALLIRAYAAQQHRFWSIVTGADIPLCCQLGGGLLLVHPNGIVIHPDAIVGPNCLILQQVTITAEVIIEGHVDIGAGAKIIGAVTLGKHSKIGANAVVLTDVPEHCTAVGIPARIVKRNEQR